MIKKTLLCGALALICLDPAFASHKKHAHDTSVQTEVTDKGISKKINALYADCALLKDAHIEVVSKDKNVALTGKVEADLQYEQAITLAQSVPGVVKVDADKLEVSASKAPLKDIYTTAKVKGIILKEKLFGDKAVEYWPISVETKDGVVYLTGVVETKEQQSNIVNLAKSISDIKSVNSTITVK